MAQALHIFTKYLSVVRRLLRTYMLEPAGSHGVWGLDDHHFVAYVWGSAQLVGHARLLPRQFVEADIYQSFAKDYMFLGCIAVRTRARRQLDFAESTCLFVVVVCVSVSVSVFFFCSTSMK